MNLGGPPRLPTSQGFRADINGLRAWAVLLVVFYHFDIPGFSGGFVGVDVFLVISGFLMTNIIAGGLASGDFRLFRFIAGRLRRVLPALATMCIILLMLGWFFLCALDYEQLAHECLSAISFVSNIRLWGEAGYFDAGAQEKWLLHTWSLSLEVQFYLTFGVLLMVAWRLRPSLKLTRRIIATIAAASLCTNIFVTQDLPSAAFYLLPTRYWEFLAGGLVALNQNLLNSRAARRASEAAGFSLIIGAAVLLSHQSTWPGAWSVLPVTGAVLVILSNNSHSTLTSVGFAQWLGTRSYSVYLWHWPLVVLCSYLGVQNDPLPVVVCILASLIIGSISYQWVEFVTARWLERTGGLAWASLAAASIAVLAASIMIYHKAGVPGRLQPAVDLVASESNNRHAKPNKCSDTWKGPGTSCLYGGDRVAAVLIGDSHALSVVSAVAQARIDPGSGVLALIYPGCVTLFSAKMVPGVFRAGRDCLQFNEAVLDALEALPENVPVILVSRTSAYALGLDGNIGNKPGRPAVFFTKEYARPEPAFLAEFSEAIVRSACELRRRRMVYLMHPIPEMPVDVPKSVARALALGVSLTPGITQSQYIEHHRTVLLAQEQAATSCEARLLDPRTFLCTPSVCPGTIAGRPIYFDDDHLSEYGNKFLVPMFRTVFVESYFDASEGSTVLE